MQMLKEWDNTTTAINNHTATIIWTSCYMQVVMNKVTVLIHNNHPMVHNNHHMKNQKMIIDQSSYKDYSEYKTKDKKYECRTGPFEGFFVSSVEFCDAKNKLTKMIEDKIEITKQAHKVQWSKRSSRSRRSRR